MSEDVLQTGLSVSVFCAFFLSTLAEDLAALHCAHFVSLTNFGFEMKIRNSGFDICDSDSIRNYPRLGYSHPYLPYEISVLNILHTWHVHCIKSLYFITHASKSQS